MKKVFSKLIHLVAEHIYPEHSQCIRFWRNAWRHRDVTIRVQLVGYDLDIYMYTRATLETQEGKGFDSRKLRAVCESRDDALDTFRPRPLNI